MNKKGIGWVILAIIIIVIVILGIIAIIAFSRMKESAVNFDFTLRCERISTCSFAIP